MSFAITTCEKKTRERGASIGTGSRGGGREELLFAEAIFRSKDLTELFDTIKKFREKRERGKCFCIDEDSTQP